MATDTESGVNYLPFKEVFKRVEKKYILSKEQHEGMMPLVEEHMCGDSYGRSTIYNIYFDTPTHALVRASIDKPVYKEKLRLRCYTQPTDDTTAFVEIKKKYKGVVYKRRISMSYRDAINFTCRGLPPDHDSQIAHEIKWLLEYYDKISPAMVLTYDRIAFFAKDNPELRITFDTNLLSRDYDFDLSLGAYGKPLLGPGECLMEVKIPSSMPLWLAHKFDELQIFPTSFSKYGSAYADLLKNT